MRNPPTQSIVKDKVLYVYLRVTQTIVYTPMFFDKFAILYEPMEEREVQDLTWHGLPISKLAPKVTTLSHPRRNMNGKGVMDRAAPNNLEVASSRARMQNTGRLVVPNASLAPPRDPFLAFVPVAGGI